MCDMCNDPRMCSQHTDTRNELETLKKNYEKLSQDVQSLKEGIEEIKGIRTMVEEIYASCNKKNPLWEFLCKVFGG